MIRHSLRAGTLFLAGLLFPGAKGFSQNPDFHIYLAFGQSNMEGSAPIEAQDKKGNPRFQVLAAVDCSNLNRKKGSWYTAIPPLCRCNTQLSPVDGFGKTLADSLPEKIKIGVVHVAVSGCKIEMFDKVNYQAQVANPPDWQRPIINDYGGNPYARLVEIAKLAQKDGVIKGILLHQGENNDPDAQWPAKVKKVYEDLIKDLGLDAKQVPLLAGELVNSDQGGINGGFNATIAKLPTALPNSHVISSKGVPDLPDNLHFNPAGYREMGKRYAVKMLSLLAKEPTGSGRDQSLLRYALSESDPKMVQGAPSLTFEIPGRAFVSLKAFSTQGEEIAELAGGDYAAGKHTINLGKGVLPKGAYLVTMKVDDFSATRKILVGVE
ncbi:MAG: sialate O-acetylesterase, partial [Fibrobacteria bacterium]